MILLKKAVKKKKKKLGKKGSFFSRIRNAFKAFLGNDDEKASFSMLEVIVIILVSILFGVLIGYIITYSRDNAVLPKSKVSEIVNTYHNIVNRYYEDIDEDKLADAAIKGMVDSLEDPYSDFLREEDANSFNQSIDGSFVGIGAVIQFEEEYNKIIEIYDGSPSYKAGLKVGDIILQVDGKDLHNVYGDEVVKLIQGKIGTDVTILIRRGEEEKEFTITRDTIELHVVSSDIIESDGKNIGYIKIDSFSANSYKQFVKQLKKVEKKSVDYLILDVRDNLGGHLLQTKQILSLFFPRRTVLYRIESKNHKKKVYSSEKSDITYPIAVLINGGSASASELFASCFQENYEKSILVGKTTYGKGMVQKSQDLSSGTTIKYTTEKWLTSKGKWIEGVGVSPDFEVEQSEEYYESPSHETDSVLQEAIQKLKESN